MNAAGRSLADLKTAYLSDASFRLADPKAAGFNPAAQEDASSSDADQNAAGFSLADPKAACTSTAI